MTLSESARIQNIPKSTLWYRKRQHDRQESGQLVKKYKRASTCMTCSKCGNNRDAVFHKQYYGSWWCAQTSEITYEQWKANVSKTKTVKKKK